MYYFCFKQCRKKMASMVAGIKLKQNIGTEAGNWLWLLRTPVRFLLRPVTIVYLSIIFLLPVI